MQKTDLYGQVILLKSDKALIQTKRISIFQRESLVDKIFFLIPLVYENMDMEPFNVTLQYIDVGGTVHAEKLNRLSDGQGGYEDYEDADGNRTHMIYTVDVTSKLTLLSGDITIKLTMDYIDYEGQTTSNSDDEEAPEPTPVHHVFNSDTTILTVKAVADYYSVVPDESLSYINQKIAELDAKQKEIEATAEIYDKEKADGIELHIDRYNQCLRLTSHGKPVGDEIDLNTLGTEISDWTTAGLVKVITDEDEPEPGPEPSDEYANNIVLVVDESTRAIYLTHNNKKIGTPIYLDDLGVAISDSTMEGLIKVITDDDNSVITDD